VLHPGEITVRVRVHHPEPDFASLREQKVSYQAAQFHHLREWCDVAYGSGASAHVDCDAYVVFDELTLLTDPALRQLTLPPDGLFVFVTHDYWCHPLQVADALRRHRNVLMVLRHQSAIDLFDRLLPWVPKVLQRPGVETSIFHPHDGAKQYDVILGGSETPDYPHRQRFNRIVRQFAPQYGWSVCDLTGIGMASNPPGTQHDYAAALAASRISPTATNRGGTAGARLAIQYLDLSVARAGIVDPFYGLSTPEISVLSLDTAGITPRYLESMASGTLLLGDLPASDAQSWYADKMVVLDPSRDDAALAAAFERWIRDDEARERITARALHEVSRTESSREKAREFAGLIGAHLPASARSGAAA
jgi:hypothetical protein